MKRFLMGFVYAGRGVIAAMKSERNMRIHLCFTFYVIVMGLICGLTAGQWTAALLCIGLVTALELVNTAVEKLCDRLCPQRDGAVGTVKDLAAGAVLAGAVCSAAVGAVLFFRRAALQAAWAFASACPLAAAALVLLLPLWMIFITGRKRK